MVEGLLVLGGAGLGLAAMAFTKWRDYRRGEFWRSNGDFGHRRRRDAGNGPGTGGAGCGCGGGGD